MLLLSWQWRDAAARHKTVEDLLTALDRLLRGEPARTPPDGYACYECRSVEPSEIELDATDLLEIEIDVDIE